ncbi:MAG: efflux RND transporter periplasmic adaptor subunit [Verrucomicrobiales bacterium]
MRSSFHLCFAHPTTFVAAALFSVSCGKKDEPVDAPMPGDLPQSVEVAEIQAMDLSETVGLVSSLAANESAELRAEIPGMLVEIGFEEGAAVKEGDVLARLDTREIDAQIAETQAQLTLAQSNLARNQLLLERDAVSKQEVDSAEAEEARLQAALELLEVRRSKSVIKAPFDGIAGSRTISIGDYLTSDTVITTVDDLSRLKVEMAVPERYLPNLQEGTNFTMRTATVDNDLDIAGEVYFVSSRIDPDTRATEVKGYVIDPPPSLKPGMFASVLLVLRTFEEALVVPETAILTTDDRGTVLIMPVENDGELVAEFVPVETGLRVPGFVQVSGTGSGIQEGDQIVSSGVGGLILYPGMKLRPVEPLVEPGYPENTDRRLR